MIQISDEFTKTIEFIEWKQIMNLQYVKYWMEKKNDQIHINCYTFSNVPESNA